MSALVETLAAELERPRIVSAQVVNHLIGTYDIFRETIGGFLVNELPNLEEYEVDLILSPLFTPTIKDQAVFAERLGRDSIAQSDWPALVLELALRPTRAGLITEDGTTQSVVLRDVTIERYVNRLRLDGTIPEPLTALVFNHEPASQRPLLKAVARRAVWENESRREILFQFLTANSAPDTNSADGAVELLKLVETYEPPGLDALLAQIPHWQRVLNQEINDASGPKPFFNERVQEMHGGGRDQRRQENQSINAKQSELVFLKRLQAALAG